MKPGLALSETAGQAVVVSQVKRIDQDVGSVNRFPTRRAVPLVSPGRSGVGRAAQKRSTRKSRNPTPVVPADRDLSCFADRSSWLELIATTTAIQRLNVGVDPYRSGPGGSFVARTTDEHVGITVDTGGEIRHRRLRPSCQVR